MPSNTAMMKITVEYIVVPVCDLFFLDETFIVLSLRSNLRDFAVIVMLFSILWR